MADYSYPTEKYPEVRAAIGLGVTIGDIPDTLLNMSIYKGEAERYIMSKLTEAQYADSALLPSVDAAATLYLASLVAPTLVAVTSERLPGGDLTFQSTDFNAVADRLRGLAEQRITTVITQSGSLGVIQPFPVVFTVAPSGVR